MIESTSQKLQSGGAEREARELAHEILFSSGAVSNGSRNLGKAKEIIQAALEKCVNAARLEEARWWRAQIDSRLHGVFYKTNDPTAARRIEDERIAELEAKK